MLLDFGSRGFRADVLRFLESILSSTLGISEHATNSAEWHLSFDARKRAVSASNNHLLAFITPNHYPVNRASERVGRATLDDRIGFRRERAHCGASSERERIRQVLANGTRSQSGRCASSYSIS